MNNQVRFGSLKLGDEFYAYGDEHSHHSKHKLMHCIKNSDCTGEEIGDCCFEIADDDLVMLQPPQPVTQPSGMVDRPRPVVPFIGVLTPHQREAIRILGEECNEVGQAVSKVCRVGPDYVDARESMSMRDLLELEIGDVLCLIDEAVKSGLIRPDVIEKRRQSKPEKLWVWTHYLGRQPSLAVERSYLAPHKPEGERP